MKGLLIDVTRCIGCGMCVGACTKANGLPQDDCAARGNGKELSADRYTVLRQVDLGDRGRRNVRQLCLHCLQPTCASVCPVGALHKTAAGPVVYEVERCIGCRYCMMACPHGVPRYEWNAMSPRVRKCVMCAGRLSKGRPTACAEACPMCATTFGDRDELLREAQRRIDESPNLYVHAVYGQTEGGGTGVLYLADESFAVLGLAQGLPPHALGENTEAVLSHLPDVVVLAGSLLFGLQWLIHRRDLLAEEREEVEQ